MLAGQVLANNSMDLKQASNAKSISDTTVPKGIESRSFDKLLSSTAKSQKIQSKDYTSKSNVQDGTPQKLIKSSNASNSKASKTDDVVGKMMSNRTNSSQLSTSSQPVKADTKSPGEKIASIVNDVKEEVMESLDITEEELVSMMQAMGLGMLDLLNPDTLKNLVLQQAGTNDPSMLLTEDGLGQQLNQLIASINDLMNQANLTAEDVTKVIEDPAEFHKMLSMIGDTPSSVTEDIVETKLETVDPQAVNEPKDMDDSKETKESKETTKESDIQFTVVKEGDASKETSNSPMSSDSEQKDSPKEFKTESTMTNQFIDQMINATGDIQEGSFSENLREIHELREITNQIVDQIKLTIKPEQTSMDFTLNPEHLGKVALNITTKNGVLTASFTAQTEATKEAIESQMQVLKDNLSNQGIKVEAIEVNVSDFDFREESNMGQESSQQQNNSSSSKRPFRMDAGEDFVTASPEETQEQATIDAGNSIDYSA